jgi:hypothetical protein
VPKRAISWTSPFAKEFIAPERAIWFFSGSQTNRLHESSARANEQELADLTLAVIAINGWNRIAISFRQSLERTNPPHVDKP